MGTGEATGENRAIEAAEAVDEITSLAPGANFNGTLTNSYGNENKVNVFGIRFQNNW